MSDKAWKAAERGIAELLGGKRDWKELEDVTHPTFSIEVKYRKQLPAWIKEAAKQAADNAPEGKLPLVVLCEKGQHREGALVLITLKNFREWYGDLT